MHVTHLGVCVRRRHGRRVSLCLPYRAQDKTKKKNHSSRQCFRSTCHTRQSRYIKSKSNSTHVHALRAYILLVQQLKNRIVFQFSCLTRIASATMPCRMRAYSGLVRVRNLSARPSSSSITMRRKTGCPVTGWYCCVRERKEPGEEEEHAVVPVESRQYER